MAANSYHRKCEWFPLKSLGWVQLDRAGNETEEPTYAHRFSLGYDIYRNDRRHQYAYVYRGTDSVLDFLWANLAVFVSLEYKFAEDQFNEFMTNRPKQYRDYEVVIVGHSLGAGLALRQSLIGPFDAFVFDPTPRLFRLSPPPYKPAKRIVVFQRDEILTILRARTSAWYDTTKSGGAVYRTDHTFGPHVDQKRGFGKQIALHDMFKLAENIRAEGARVNPRLTKAKLSPRPNAECHLPSERKRTEQVAEWRQF